jgi:hypothetical protein
MCFLTKLIFKKNYLVFLFDFQNYPMYLDLCNYLMILIFFGALIHGVT